MTPPVSDGTAQRGSMMSDRLPHPAPVAVTGVGACTAFGVGVDALRRGVFAGETGIRPVTRFDVAPYRAGVAATLRDDDAVWASGGPNQLDLLRASVAEALAMAGTAAEGAPLLLGTLGDRSAVVDFWRGTRDDVGWWDARLDSSAPAALSATLAEEFGFGRAPVTFTNACIASTTAVAYGAQLIRSGRADLVVCGGAHVVSEDIFSKFDAGGAFSRAGVVRPFCKQRDGMLHGDGAAVLILESVRSAQRRGAAPLALLRGWGMSADAYHPIQPDPTGGGMARAMRSALSAAGCSREQVQYVNAHGTGTKVNDKAETSAVQEVFGKGGPVAVSSTKGATGHMLEATGAVEAVITLLSLTDQRVPPTVGYLEADPECALDCVPHSSRQAEVTHALSLNAAFGGANAALLFSTVEAGSRW